MKTELEDKIEDLATLCERWVLNGKLNMPRKGLQGAILIVCQEIMEAGKK